MNPLIRLCSKAFLLLLFPLSLSAQNYVYSGGTTWAFPNIIQAKDASAFKSAEYVTSEAARMYDRDANNNQGDWIKPEAYIYRLTYDDYITSEIRIRKKDFDRESANRLAQKYGHKMGQLPACLRRGTKYVNILKSDALFGGNNYEKSIEITIGKTSEEYEKVGNMEETILHEAAHAALDDIYQETEWTKTRDRDKKYISSYAAEYPNREDIAESFLCFVGVNFRRDRVNREDTQKIKTNNRNRLQFFERFNNDMYPVQVSVAESSSGNNPFDPNKYYRLTTQFTGPEKSLDIVNDDQDNKLIMAKTGNYSGQYWKIEAVINGYYRLTTQFTGREKSLDIINDNQGNKLIMAKTGNYSGQYWKIEALGNDYYRLTTQFTGKEKSLDIINDTQDDQLIMAKTGRYSGQYWKITEVK
ncbi:MAG: RICIN domain-containing protein [Bacteroidota bacterium]